MYLLGNHKCRDFVLVYSTDVGRIKEEKASVVRPKGDGSVVRIQKQTSGRKGAGVSVITGLDLSDEDLKKLAAELKKRCGCGGSVKMVLLKFKGKNEICSSNY